MIMKSYKYLSQNIFEYNNFKIVPIRFENRFNIMNCRKEQIYNFR